MNLFGCKFCETMKGSSDVECDRKNFDSLLWAIVTVFQVPTKKKIKKRKRKRKKKDTFSRIFSRAFLTSLYSVYYLYIFIRAYILTLYHTASTCAKYIYVLVTFWFFRQVKVVRSLATCVRLHFIWFLRLQVTYILGDKRFPACRRHFFDEGEGGKGRRRLPVSTLEVAETLTKYYISAFFFSLRERSFFRSSSYFLCWIHWGKRGWGEKAWLEPVLEAHRRSTWIIKRCIRLPGNFGASSFRVYQSLRKHNTCALIHAASCRVFCERVELAPFWHAYACICSLCMS